MAPNDFLNYLDDCVALTEQCGHTLAQGTTSLEMGVSDLPRLCKVLQNHHRFLVLPETTVQTHKTALSHSLTPQIENLITKAESSIEAQRSKIKRLEEKLSILEDARSTSREEDMERERAAAGRGGDEAGEEGGDGGGMMESQMEGVDLGEATAVQKRKIAILKGRRRRLEVEREQLGL